MKRSFGFIRVSKCVNYERICPSCEHLSQKVSVPQKNSLDCGQAIFVQQSIL